MSADLRQRMLRDNRIIIALLGILTAIGVGVVLYQARSILLPFALAVFLTYILNPLITFFERRRVPGAISILLAVLLSFVALGLIGLLINQSVQSFAENFPRYEKRIEKFRQRFMSYMITEQSLSELEKEGVPPGVIRQLRSLKDEVIIGREKFLQQLRQLLGESRVELYRQAILRHSVNEIQFFNLPPGLFSSEEGESEGFQWLSTLNDLSLAKVITQTLRSITRFLSNTIMVLLFLVFILLGRNQLRKKLAVAFEPEVAEKISGMVTNINRQIQKYILAKTMISLMTALLVTIVLFAFKVEFFLVWGILTFLLNFIPSIGSVIATILPLAVAMIQFESPMQVFWVAILVIAIQVIIGNFVDPRVVGDSVNLSPLVVLFSLIFWGWMWGIIGMFLAVPISVVIKIVLENIDSLRPISVLMSARK
ncbi:MAG: AI-2E family transporter [Calditrichaeota bacterium]|nr:MAG: AI-2E family transporter [Calditrichota bacterium]